MALACTIQPLSAFLSTNLKFTKLKLTIDWEIELKDLRVSVS